MHIPKFAVASLLVLPLLAACGGDNTGPAADNHSSAPSATVDCSDPDLSQADWMANCASATDDSSLALEFGQSYTWPDGLKVSVLDAATFTAFSDDDLAAEPSPNERGFRLRLKLTNGSSVAVPLDDVSTFVEGATSGGEATAGGWAKDARPLEGRLGAGVSQIFTDDNVLETRYGSKIVVTVQRVDFDFPEFSGAIK